MASAVSASQQKQIESSLAAGEIKAALDVIESFPDLRHTDMPPVSKGTLAALGKNAKSTQALVIACASSSVSVRRFCRKYIPKLGDSAASPLLALLTESFDPFRPVPECGPGLLGSFGGFASPIAQHITEAKLGFEFKEPQAYSPASRYAKEVMDDLTFVLGAVSHEFLLRAREFIDASARAQVYGSWPHADFRNPYCAMDMSAHLTKDETRWGEAVLRYANRQLTIDLPSNDPVAQALTERFKKLPEAAQTTYRNDAGLLHCRTFRVFTREHRMALYQAFTRRMAEGDKKNFNYFTRTLEEYRTEFPDEVAAVGQSAAAPAQADAPASSKAEPAQPSVAEGLGPAGNFSLYVLLSLSRALGLKAAYDAVRKTLDEKGSELEASRAAAAPKDEQLLLAIHDFIVTSRTNHKEKSARPWDDNTYVPEQSLRNASFDAALAELLTRCVADPALSEKRRTILDAAVTFLSLESMNRFAAAWPKSFLDEPLSFEASRDVVDALAARQLAPAPLLRVLMASVFGESWERAVALLYHRGGESGRAVARELALIYAPPQANPHYKRRQFGEPYQSAVWAAWQAQDAEFLASACERCIMPYYMKGTQPMLPDVPPLFHSSNYASRTREQGGVPLSELWNHVRTSTPKRVPDILKAALKYAEADEFPRVLLELEGESKDSPLLEMEDGVLELLESSQAAVVTTGLTVLSLLPALAGKRTDDAIRLSAQSLSATQVGTAKIACAALVALAETFEKQRQAILDKLSFALALENVALLQQVIRSIKQVRGSGKAALALKKDTLTRLQELSDDDPAKFQKLVQSILKGA
jgi:hypothetical protein